MRDVCRTQLHVGPTTALQDHRKVFRACMTEAGILGKMAGVALNPKP